MTDYEMEDLVEKEEAFDDLMEGTLGFITLGLPQLDDIEKKAISISLSLHQATFDINQVMDNEYKRGKKEEVKKFFKKGAGNKNRLQKKYFETKREHTWKIVHNWVVNFSGEW